MLRHRIHKGFIIRKLTVSALFLPLVLLGAAFSAHGADDYCEAIGVRGQVFTRLPEGQKKEIREGDFLQTGQVLEIGPQSYLDVAFDRLHNNVARLESDSEVTLRRLGRPRLGVKIGGVFAKLGNLPAKSSFDVETPTAIAAVRGSVYRTVCEPGGASTVYNFSDSPVYVYGVDSSGNASGEPKVLDNLEKTTVPSLGQPPAEPEKMLSAEIEGTIAIQSGLEESVFAAPGARNEPGAEASTAPGAGEKTGEEILIEMARAYEAEDMASFTAHLSDSFAWRGELEEFVRRDFKDYDGIKLNLFFKRTVDSDEGVDVRVDWQLQFSPTALSSVIELRGSDLTFFFVRERGGLKLKAMKGANPLFGARSPEIAALSGVSSSVVNTLQEIEDTGSRAAKQTAMALVAESESVSSQSVPVNFEIVEIKATNTGGTTEYDLTSIPGTGTYRFRIRARLVDNPKAVSLSQVRLEVAESRTGAVLRGRGDILAGQTAVITTDDSVTLTSGSGTVTFVLDPDREFSIIDRNTARTSANHTVL